jgi:hypothetical protein
MSFQRVDVSSASRLHIEHTRSRFQGAELMGDGCRTDLEILRGYEMHRMNISQMISGGMNLVGEVACPSIVRIFVDGACCRPGDRLCSLV